METEEKLAVDWLQQRFLFDNRARDHALLQQALQLLHNKPAARVVDLGAGTGNNALFLAPRLPRGCELTVVEQHDYLLQACQQRFSNAHESNLTTRFVQQDLHQWLSETTRVDLICNSALLDLMTEQELSTLLHRLQALEAPMYSTLNYQGVRFLPGDEADAGYIKLFERHMSRKLDRGQPLGARTLERLQSLCKQIGLTVKSAPSSWEITALDSGFMQMNLTFYQRGIEALLTEPDDKAALYQWLVEKQSRIEDGTLTLRVLHQDVLVEP